MEFIYSTKPQSHLRHLAAASLVLCRIELFKFSTHRRPCLHLFVTSVQVLQQSGLPTAVPLQQAAPGDGADGDTATDPVASPDADEDQQSVSEQTVGTLLTLSRLPSAVMLRTGPSLSAIV